MSILSINRKYWPSVIAIIFFLFYFLGLIFPEFFWATHFLAFLPEFWKIIFPVAGLGFILGSFIQNDTFSYKILPDKIKFHPAFYLLIPGVFGILFFLFPIHTDTYGDSLAIKAQTDFTIVNWKPWMWQELFNFNVFDFKIGESTFFSLVNTGSYLTGEHGHSVIVGIGVASGVVYVFLWIKMVSLIISRFIPRILLVFAGLTAPFTLVFYGHYEVYAPAFPALLGFFLALVIYYKTNKKIYFLLLFPLTLLAIKTHITAFFLVPALAITAGHYFFSDRHWFIGLFTWKNFSRFFIIPVAVTGLLIYLFVTKSFNGGRNWSRDTLNDFIFLPVNGKDGPPLDRYDLFSFSHFFDYFNIIFIWSGAIVFLLIVVVLLYRTKVNWNSPPVLITGLTLILYISAFSVLNPLLGMSTDWDLFSLPAPILLVFTLLLVAQIQWDKRIGSAFLGLAILGIPVFMVNANPESLSQRLQYKGIYDFKTYWKGSFTPLNTAMEMETDISLVEQRRLDILEELESWAVIGKDTEYSALLCEMGLYYSEIKLDVPLSIKYFNLSYQYDPLYRKNIYYLVLGYFHIGELNQAFSYTQLLTQVQYPNIERAYRVSIHVALEAGEYEAANIYCQNYLNEGELEDPLIQKVFETLNSGDDPALAIKHFRRE